VKSGLEKIDSILKQTIDNLQIEPTEEENYNCPRCKDLGYIIKGDRAYPCSCLKEKILREKLQFSHLTPQMRTFNFENFKLKYYSKEDIDPITGRTYWETAQKSRAEAKRFAEECLKNPHAKGILFIGPVGSGKTFLSVAIANYLLSRGKFVLFLVVPDFLDEIRYSFEGKNNEEEIIERARSAEVLILDDLGAHNYTTWTQNKLYSIINFRLIHQLPTVVNTNLELDELEEYLGERILSRLCQLCRVYRLLIKEDIRRQKLKEEIRKDSK